ncbi:MAG: hypothetical protein COA94_06770 [Rickettsiales bacterium]|nr:MAG: hypothetical protein COA94_06770 [Rickettsiales bacterium]
MSKKTISSKDPEFNDLSIEEQFEILTSEAEAEEEVEAAAKALDNPGSSDASGESGEGSNDASDASDEWDAEIAELEAELAEISQNAANIPGKGSVSNSPSADKEEQTSKEAQIEDEHPAREEAAGSLRSNSHDTHNIEEARLANLPPAQASKQQAKQKTEPPLPEKEEEKKPGFIDRLVKSFMDGLEWVKSKLSLTKEVHLNEGEGMPSKDGGSKKPGTTAAHQQNSEKSLAERASSLEGVIEQRGTAINQRRETIAGLVGDRQQNEKQGRKKDRQFIEERPKDTDGVKRMVSQRLRHQRQADLEIKKLQNLQRLEEKIQESLRQQLQQIAGLLEDEEKRKNLRHKLEQGAASTPALASASASPENAPRANAPRANAPRANAPRASARRVNISTQRKPMPTPHVPPSAPPKAQQPTGRSIAGDNLRKK